MALPVGTRLSAYEIVTLIAKGGMGEVYRARDTKLHRDVAIKVVPDTFAHDRDRLTRFEREAQTLAALNHPNIAHIYGLDTQSADSGPVAFIAMEYVEGEELAPRIRARTNSA
jgi:serine/threonine protein kinase